MTLMGVDDIYNGSFKYIVKDLYLSNKEKSATSPFQFMIITTF